MDSIFHRISVRKYEDKMVEKEKILQILKAGMQAPSACNQQPWEFYVVERRETLDLLMQAHPACKMLETATLAIAVCGRPDLQPGRGFWPQDCGAAVENILLQATDLGYGTCWCGLYPSEERYKQMQELIGADSIPMAVIAVGVADEEPAQRGHYDEARVKFID